MLVYNENYTAYFLMSKHFILVDIKTALYKNLSMKNSHINVHNNLSKIKESFTVPWNLQ